MVAVIRKIIHADVDPISAAVEQRNDTSIRARPVAVVHTATQGALEASAFRMANDMWRWRMTRQAFGRTVTVKVKCGDCQQITRSRNHPAALVTQEASQRSALEVIRSALPPKKGIRLVGVAVSNFAEPRGAPLSELPIFAEVAA